MISEVICDCGIIFADKSGVKWHRTTQGHLWSKLKKEWDGNYVYRKKKIPKDARCDICNGAQKKGKRAPKWFIVANKEKLIVRCKKCKKEKLDLIKSEFAKIVNWYDGSVNPAFYDLANDTLWDRKEFKGDLGVEWRLV
jgi:hypothetical protein